jgi:hypothetical protein
MELFNPALTDFLNDLGYTSSDWPNNVPEIIKKQADCEIGGGYLLDDIGWPMIGFEA